MFAGVVTYLVSFDILMWPNLTFFRSSNKQNFKFKSLSSFSLLVTYMSVESVDSTLVHDETKLCFLKCSQIFLVLSKITLKALI